MNEYLEILAVLFFYYMLCAGITSFVVLFAVERARRNAELYDDETREYFTAFPWWRASLLAMFWPAIWVKALS